MSATNQPLYFWGRSKEEALAVVQTTEAAHRLCKGGRTGRVPGEAEHMHEGTGVGVGASWKGACVPCMRLCVSVVVVVVVVVWGGGGRGLGPLGGGAVWGVASSHARVCLGFV